MQMQYLNNHIVTPLNIYLSIVYAVINTFCALKIANF